MVSAGRSFLRPALFMKAIAEVFDCNMHRVELFVQLYWSILHIHWFIILPLSRLFFKHILK